MTGSSSWRAWQPTALAAGLAIVAASILIVAVDRAAPGERPVVLASLQESARWLATALIGAGSTIAALMLATISLLERLETRRMQPAVLIHLRLTVFGAVATIAGAVGALLLTAFPTEPGAAATPGWLGDGVFYGLQGVLALMVGAFAVVLTSLAATVADVLRTLPPEVVEEILDEPAACWDHRPRRSATRWRWHVCSSAQETGRCGCRALPRRRPRT